MKTEDRKFEDESHPLNQFAPDETMLQRPQTDPRTWQKATTYCVLIVLGGGVGILGNQLIDRYSATPIPPAPASVPQNPPARSTTPTANTTFITNVVDTVGPAVVRIDATQTVNTPTPEGFNDPFFRQFFGDNLPTPPSKEIVRGVGSGFIINGNGEILTNAHVVNNADTVTVTLKDGRTFKGKVMGTDPVTDVAVVKINAKDLPTVSMGNSEQLQPGQWAIAIGNPLGLNNTVTEGIISATGRSSGVVGFPNERVNFIQTDAAINPGNSGGPLLNAQGQVIGMNTAIIQGAQGIGFAIPINTAKAIANQLIAKGEVNHPFLGIQMVTLTPEVKNTLNNDPNSSITTNQDRGVLIIKVQPDSPADKAGIRAGDVITQINGQSVKTGDQVQQVVNGIQVGDQLRLNLNRNGQTLNLMVKAGRLASQDVQPPDNG
jgi:Do/DeqQ family serine protease